MIGILHSINSIGAIMCGTSDRIRTLEDELAQAKADRDVLAAEVRAWRNAEHLRINEPHNEFMTRADARADTDASGALSRAGGK